MKRVTHLLYGTVSYLLFLGTFTYAFFFIGNFFVPKSIDSPGTMATGAAVIIDMALLGLFAVQHSVMARKWFKDKWTKIVPVQLERSTYVLFANIMLIILFIFWQPVGGVIWEVKDTVWRNILLTFFVFGWLLAVVSTFMSSHFDLFGLRQVWLYFSGKNYTPIKFVNSGLYKLVRHPLYLGLIIGFWAAPTMTITHLFFALATTAYILVAIRFEENDLIGAHGKKYADYKKTTPMIIPVPKNKEYTNILAGQ